MAVDRRRYCLCLLLLGLPLLDAASAGGAWRRLSSARRRFSLDPLPVKEERLAAPLLLRLLLLSCCR